MHSQPESCLSEGRCAWPRGGKEAYEHSASAYQVFCFEQETRFSVLEFATAAPEWSDIPLVSRNSPLFRSNVNPSPVHNDVLAYLNIAILYILHSKKNNQCSPSFDTFYLAAR